MSILFAVKEYEEQYIYFTSDSSNRSLSEGWIVNDQHFQDIFHFDSKPEAHSLKCVITRKQINVGINQETKEYNYGNSFPVIVYSLFKQIIAEGKIKIQPTDNLSTAFHRHIHFAKNNAVKTWRSHVKSLIQKLLNNVDLPINMIVYGGDDQYWLGIQGYFTAYGTKLYLSSGAFGFGIFKDERDRKMREHKIPFGFIETDEKSDKILFSHLMKRLKWVSH